MLSQRSEGVILTERRLRVAASLEALLPEPTRGNSMTKGLQVETGGKESAGRICCGLCHNRSPGRHYEHVNDSVQVGKTFLKIMICGGFGCDICHSINHQG